MPVLDFRASWLSTYHMLERAEQYRESMNAFVRMADMDRALQLSDSDWLTIKTAKDWLHDLQAAMKELRASKASSALNDAFSMFQGLRRAMDDFRGKLPADAPAEISLALFNAHRKLTEYNMKTRDSQYYIWAAGKSDPSFLSRLST
jgi:hypothetical protein